MEAWWIIIVLYGLVTCLAISVLGFQGICIWGDRCIRLRRGKGISAVAIALAKI